MIKKLLILTLFIIISSFSLGGCWNSQEPKELGLITSLIYDKTETGYKTYIEILSPSSSIQGSSQSRSSMIIVSEGESLPEAVRNASNTLERKIYGGNNKVRFFTEKMLEQDMVETVDFFLRDHLADERPFLIAIKGDVDPLDIYNTQLGLSDILGIYVEDMSDENTHTIDHTVFIRTIDFVTDYYRQGKQPVIGVVEVKKSESKLDDSVAGDSLNLKAEKVLVFEGMAVFREGVFLGYLGGNEAKAYNFIVNDAKHPLITVELDGKQIIGRINKSKCKIEMSEENSEIKAKIKLKQDLTILQNESEYNLSDYRELSPAEQALSEKAKEEIINTVTRVQQEYQSDIFGFGCKFHNKYPKRWKEIMNDWDQVYFPNMQLEVEVESEIKMEGEIEERFGERVENE
jgi:spore germination protein KC